MQARIAEIEYDPKVDIKYKVHIDIHNGRQWHHSACFLYADNIHEGARIGLAICRALDTEPDTTHRRPN